MCTYPNCTTIEAQIIPRLESSSKTKNKKNIIIMTFIVFGFVFDNEGFGTQDREDMQAYLPAFPPLFPGYGVELCLFEVSHTTKQRDALRCVDVPGFRESFYLGYGVESCGFCYVSVRAVLTQGLKVLEDKRFRASKHEPFSGCDSLLCDRVDMYVREPGEDVSAKHQRW